MIVSRDPSKREAAIHVVRGPVPANSELTCDANEVAVLLRDGRVLGTLGPGRVALTHAAAPFLQMALAPDGSLAATVYFVATSPLRGIRFGGPIGGLTEASGASVAPRVLGEATVAIADPMRIVQAVSAAPDSDPSATFASYVGYAVLEATQSVAASTQDVQSLVASAHELATRVVDSARPRLAEVGIDLRELSTFTLTLSEEAQPHPAPPAEVAYEMLWDCKFCGTKKLLGLKHRYCPSCGAPQNAVDRYFPSDADKVRAEDHVYVGADVRCGHCGEANSRNSKHCEGCGAPLEGVADIGVRQDQVVAGGAAFAGGSAADARLERQGAKVAPAGPKRSSTAKVVASIGCLSVLAILALVIVAVTWKKEAELVVTGHTWRREIAIERFGPTADSSWCDSVPAMAHGIRRSSEVKSHRRIPDGQDCRTRKVDRGNGTFVEKQECSTRYRDEPVYDDRCYYTIDRWAVARTVDASGASVKDVRWPDVGALRACIFIGCERVGSRKETYTVELTDPKSGKQTCSVDPNKWATLGDGSRWKGGIRVIGGGLDCATLAPN